MSAADRTDHTGDFRGIHEVRPISWRACADSLASWVWRYLVNRTDCYGRYFQRLQGLHPNDYAVFNQAVPVGSCTVWKPLTENVVQRHFVTFDTRGLIGLHVTAPDDTCRWIEWDIDQHDPNVTAIAERNCMAAMTWYHRLCELGFTPLLWHSNGKGGFRLNVRLEAPIPATNAYSFGHWLARDWLEFGLPEEPEVFPKQPSIADTGKRAGNYVRLIGRHHKRHYYPEVYNGKRWLRDEQAVQYILSLGGQSPSLIPQNAVDFLPRPKPRGQQERASSAFYLPALAQAAPALKRARAILQRWQAADVGFRNAALFRAGCTLGERLPISPEDHLQALSEFNSRFPEPLDDREVRRIAQSSFDRTASKRGRIRYCPTAVESFVASRTDHVYISDYRAALQKQYMGLLGHPGIYLDRTVVGGGKTHQGYLAAAHCQSSLHVIPTHDIKRQMVESLIQISGLNSAIVAPFPERNAANCQRWDDVQRLYRLGISIPSALCSTCEVHRNCPHLSEKDIAEAAHHSIGTMARMEESQLARIGAAKEFIKIDENAINLLRPLAKVGADDLRAVLVAVEAASQLAASSSDFRHSKAFLQALMSSGTQLLSAIAHATTCTDIPIPKSTDHPAVVEFLMAKGFRQARIDAKQSKIAEAKKLLFGLAGGELLRCVVQVDDSENGQKEGTFLVGVWATALPRNANGRVKCPIVFADGTADAEMLQLLIGEPVVDITPPGHVKPARRLVQIPVDVKRSTTAESFLEIVRGIMVANPTKKRIGIICHSSHHNALSRLGKTLANRIVKATYFGSGEDRASNEWLELGLDLLLVVGTPRIGPSDVRTRMIQLGLDRSAPSSSKWVSRWWQGKTENGDEIVIRTRKYADSVWERVYDYDVQAGLRQAIGRARAILPHGIDVFVVTCEPLGLPLADQSVIPVPKTTAACLDLLADGIDNALADYLATKLNLSRRAAFDQLSLLQRLGVLGKQRRGQYQLTTSWIADNGVDNQPPPP